MDEEWTLYVGGARGSRPISGPKFEKFGGDTSCYIMKRGDYALVLDCGTGLYRSREIFADCKRVDIVLTHLHYDHIIGLLGFKVIPRGTTIRIFGSFHHWVGESTLDVFFRHPFWPLVHNIGEYVDIESPGRVQITDGVSMLYHPSGHPNDANAVRLDLGEVSICALFDYEHNYDVPAEMLQGCSLLLYDGMYTEQEYPLHVGWGHSCWQKGCHLAQKYGIARILIVHHDPERTDEELEEMEREAQTVMPKLRFARIDDRIKL